jgi:hypothetical protein
MLYVLYECGSIGHSWHAPGYSEWRLDFKYRNPNSVISSQYDIILLECLSQALNLTLNQTSFYLIHLPQHCIHRASDNFAEMSHSFGDAVD